MTHKEEETPTLLEASTETEVSAQEKSLSDVVSNLQVELGYLKHAHNQLVLNLRDAGVF